MQKTLVASNNRGKLERYQRIAKHHNLLVVFVTPKDLNIEKIDTPENGTLAENALEKALAYRSHADLPITANDTGFWVDGEGFVTAPKRAALQGDAEHDLTEQQLYDKILGFWKSIATKHGGRVDAAWVGAFALVRPDGTIIKKEARREVILTDTEFGTAQIHLPVRALYISQITQKPSVNHVPAEEMAEMQPIADVFFGIFWRIILLCIQQDSSKKKIYKHYPKFLPNRLQQFHPKPLGTNRTL